MSVEQMRKAISKLYNGSTWADKLSDKQVFAAYGRLLAKGAFTKGLDEPKKIIQVAKKAPAPKTTKSVVEETKGTDDTLLRLW